MPTLKQILRKATVLSKMNQVRVNNAKFVSIRSYSQSKGRTITTTREPGHPPRKHQQKIYAADPSYTGKLSECPNVYLSCTCDDWQFTCEWVAAKNGCADIRFGNGAPPVERNPNSRFLLCKHCIVVASYILRSKL
jgi:hypothetical protein